MASPDGLLIVDYGASGRPVGVEITSPQAVPLERLGQLFAELGEAPGLWTRYLIVRLTHLRQTIEKLDLPGFQRILGAYDEKAISLDQLLEDFRSVSQMVC